MSEIGRQKCQFCGVSVGQIFDLNKVVSLIVIDCQSIFVRKSQTILFEVYFFTDFRNESNGIFVLGVFFVSSDTFRLFNKRFFLKFF